MNLIIGLQKLDLFPDGVCDLCREQHNPSLMITVNINVGHESHNRKQQLVVCPSCSGKLAKGIQNCLASLIVGIEEEEIIQL